MERDKISDTTRARFNELAKDVETYMEAPNPQATHIRAYLDEMKELGIEILPLVKQKMDNNIAYAWIFEKLVYLNTDDEIVEDQTIQETDGKLGHLEPLRQACNKWWEINKSKFK